MPLIEFPDVPIAAGVPALVRMRLTPQVIANQAAQEAALARAETVPIPNYPIWSIVDANGDKLIEPDSFIEFEYRGESKLASHPVEPRSFATYNKISTPFDARMVVACTGSGNASRGYFLKQLHDLQEGLTLCYIVTPDGAYENCNLVHMDYRREARQGVTLLLCQLWWQEVKTTGQARVTTAKPSGASPVKAGQLSTLLSTPKQTAASGGVQ